MIIIDKITTKFGDKGYTLGPKNKKTHKSEIEIEFIGMLDELNSFIGNVNLYCNKEISLVLGQIQQDLFNIGAAFYTKNEENLEKMILFLEEKIEQYNKNLPALNSFLIPTGEAIIVALHLARCIARKAERKFFKMKLDSKIGIYLNRLSDLFFVLIRFHTKKEILWDYK